MGQHCDMRRGFYNRCKKSEKSKNLWTCSPVVVESDSPDSKPPHMYFKNVGSILTRWTVISPAFFWIHTESNCKPSITHRRVVYYLEIGMQAFVVRERFALRDHMLISGWTALILNSVFKQVIFYIVDICARVFFAQKNQKLCKNEMRKKFSLSKWTRFWKRGYRWSQWIKSPPLILMY